MPPRLVRATVGAGVGAAVAPVAGWVVGAAEVGAVAGVPQALMKHQDDQNRGTIDFAHFSPV
jgi:hypothetical protein